MKEKTKLRVIQILCIVSLLITVFSIQKTYARYFEKIGTTYDSNIKRWVINVNNNNIHRNNSLSEVMQPVLVANEHINNNVLVPGREGYFDFEIDYSKVDLNFRFNFDIEQLNTKNVINEETQEETEVENYLEDFEVYGYKIIDGENTDTTDITSLSKISPIIDVVQGKITYTKIVIASESELTDLQVQRVLEEFEDGTKKVEITKIQELDTDKKVDVRVLFRWNDDNKDTTDTDEQEGMNNAEDTAYAGEAIEGDSIHTNLNYNVKITFTQQL